METKDCPEPKNIPLEELILKELHLCRDYLEGKCKFTFACKHVHDPTTDLAWDITGCIAPYGKEELMDIKYINQPHPIHLHEEWRGWKVTLKMMEYKYHLVRLKQPLTFEHTDLYSALRYIRYRVKRPDFKPEVELIHEHDFECCKRAIERAKLYSK